jgi:hypothetical protein
MCHRPRVFLISLLVATMNVSAQDSAPPLRSSSPKEKAQALAALTEARGARFPQRRKDEARQLLARIAPLLAAGAIQPEHRMPSRCCPRTNATEFN